MTCKPYLYQLTSGEWAVYCPAHTPPHESEPSSRPVAEARLRAHHQGENR